LDRFISKGGSEETLAEDSTRFLVHIADNGCELGLVRDNALIYSRSFDWSRKGREAVNDEAVKEQADEILAEIETTRLSMGDDSPEIPQLIVSGNGVDQNLIDHLEEKENIDARLMNNLNINMGDIREEIPCLSAAIGLALKGLKGVALDVNFIPRELRPKRKKNWSLICGVAVVVLFLLGISSFTISFFVKERIYFTELSERIDALKGRVKEIERMQGEIADIENKMGSVEKIKVGDISKLKILKELTQIIPEEMWLTRFSYNEKKGERKVDLSGYAEAASEIIPILEESELFEDVKFKSSIVKDKRSNKEKFNVTATVSSN
ncbi:MAG: PilN domain-containing protein, partial [Deltaproteobacteria bacterium]|nr:PilN domain-containing protein [Deltaproteobacteria bacterium]